MLFTTLKKWSSLHKVHQDLMLNSWSLDRLAFAAVWKILAEENWLKSQLYKGTLMRHSFIIYSDLIHTPIPGRLNEYRLFEYILSFAFIYFHRAGFVKSHTLPDYFLLLSFSLLNTGFLKDKVCQTEWRRKWETEKV